MSKRLSVTEEAFNDAVDGQGGVRTETFVFDGDAGTFSVRYFKNDYAQVTVRGKSGGILIEGYFAPKQKKVESDTTTNQD